MCRASTHNLLIISKVSTTNAAIFFLFFFFQNSPLYMLHRYTYILYLNACWLSSSLSIFFPHFFSSTLSPQLRLLLSLYNIVLLHSSIRTSLYLTYPPILPTITYYLPTHMDKVFKSIFVFSTKFTRSIAFNVVYLNTHR